MVDPGTSIRSEVAQHPGTSLRWWSPWLVLGLALSAPASYALSMVLPYYVNDLDRLPLAEMAWGADPGELWPYNTAYGFPSAIAGLYAISCAPFVAMGVVLWALYWTSARWRSAPWSARAVMSLAAAISTATVAWLMTSPLASALLVWFLG